MRGSSHSPHSRLSLQFLYHVWREHTRLWDAMLAEVLIRKGAPAEGPPPDLPQRILVRAAWVPSAGSLRHQGAAQCDQ